MITAEADGPENAAWLKAIRKRGLEVHIVDGRSMDPGRFALIQKAELVVLDGAPSTVRAWKPLVRLELERYLDSGKALGFLWHGDGAPDGAPLALETRLRNAAKVSAPAKPADGPLTGGLDHRRRPHCILNGVALEGLATQLAAPCRLDPGANAVVSLGAQPEAAHLAWTSSYRGSGERSGNVFVVQAAGGDAFGAGAYPQLVANAVFWAMDWEDLIPATGVRLK
ncbi:MAG: hypothetical protein HKN82_11235 [Akkermansiaceae bacterium]|nr:hypothetical protein [Akkermansiaceae bacterium]